MPKFKRELIPGSYLTAADMLQALGQQQLTAAALDNTHTIMLAAEPALAWLLDNCCVGKPLPDTLISTRTIWSGSSSGSSGSTSTAALVAATAGVNQAPQELQEQYEQYQVQLQYRRQRRGMRAVALTNAVAGPSLSNGAAFGVAPQPPEDHVQQQQGPGQQQQQQPQQQTTTAAAEDNRTVSLEGRGMNADKAAVIGSLSSSGCETAQLVDSAVLQLVQLTFQEAFFLAHVLKCCKVMLVASTAVQQGGSTQQEQRQQQNQDQAVVQQDSQQQHRQLKQQEQQLSEGELWRWCCSHMPGGELTFVTHYAAYHHFRSKGWLPLPGLLYGADYVLYKLHPEYAHSDFVVTVMLETAAREGPIQPAAAAVAAGVQQLGDSDHDDDAQQVIGVGVQQQLQHLAGLELEAGQQAEQQQQDCSQPSSSNHSSSSSTQLSWLDAHIMQRLARQVLKQLLLLYVVVPPGLQLHSADCMQQLAVREVLLQRWVPSEHREDGK